MGFPVKWMLDTDPSEKIAWLLLLLDVGGQHRENVLPLLVQQQLQQLTLERHRPAESDPFG
jgi:hypothetical protein